MITTIGQLANVLTRAGWAWGWYPDEGGAIVTGHRVDLPHLFDAAFFERKPEFVVSMAWRARLHLSARLTAKYQPFWDALTAASLQDLQGHTPIGWASTPWGRASARVARACGFTVTHEPQAPEDPDLFATRQ